MGDIRKYLQDILDARYGEEVRGSIHDAIQQCYDDGKAGTVDYEAREELTHVPKLNPDTGKIDKSVIPDDIVAETTWDNIQGKPDNIVFGEVQGEITPPTHQARELSLDEITFDSGDMLNPSSAVDMPLFESGNMESRFGLIGKLFRNVRWLSKSFTKLQGVVVTETYKFPASKTDCQPLASTALAWNYDASKSGYRPLGIVGYTSPGSPIVPYYSYVNSVGELIHAVRNTNSTVYSIDANSVSIKVLYIKEDFFV